MADDLRIRVENHPVIKGLIKNPAWRPVAQAAISYFVDQKECAIEHWRTSKVWGQVEAVVRDLRQS